jgi:hypothetical protein
MNVKQLVTYSFSKNVGRWDRAFRITSGLALTIVGWTVRPPMWIAVALTSFGVAWMLTGAVSRCALYCMLGYSTCPRETAGSATR